MHLHPLIVMMKMPAPLNPVILILVVNMNLSAEDNNACTTDWCDCESGCQHEDVDCDDNNKCTEDSCDETEGCQNVAISCDDYDLY